MGRTILRLTLAVPLLAAGIGVTSTVARVGPAAPLCAQAAFAHRVGLVVEHGDGRVLRVCVGFNGASVSALGVLEASGLETGLDSYGPSLGTAICQIDDEPPRYTDCLPASGSYWVLFVARGGGPWSDSALGASTVVVTAGDDIGFRYDPQAGADPPPPSPSGTCPAATPAPATHSNTPARSTGPSSVPGAKPAAATPPATAGVLGASTPAARPSPATEAPGIAAGAGSPLNLGLLLAVVGGGALLGLLAVQGSRRRRR